MSMSMPEPWWRGAVICQVYPRSFRDTNGDGIGDLPDITEKLDHIARLAVDRNSADPDSVLSTVRRVLAWRRQHPAMVGGEFFMADTREPVFAFERQSGGERIF